MSSDYFDSEALSNSMLKTLKESPAEFHARYIAKDYPQQYTEAFQTGHLLHCLALEPQCFDERYQVMSGPINERTGKPFGKDTKAYTDWLASFKPTEGLQVIESDDYYRAVAMVRSLNKHPVISKLLNRGSMLIEQPVYGKLSFENADLDFRCKPDLVLVEEGIVVDVKTSEDASPSNFKSSAYKFGYETQAWLYTRLLQQHYNREFTMLFAVVSKSAEPNQDDKPTMDRVHATGLYELSHKRLERARNEIIQLCENYMRFNAEGWPKDWRKDICILD